MEWLTSAGCECNILNDNCPKANVRSKNTSSPPFLHPSTHFHVIFTKTLPGHSFHCINFFIRIIMYIYVQMLNKMKKNTRTVSCQSEEVLACCASFTAGIAHLDQQPTVAQRTGLGGGAGTNKSIVSRCARVGMAALLARLVVRQAGCTDWLLV